MPSVTVGIIYSINSIVIAEKIQFPALRGELLQSVSGNCLQNSTKYSVLSTSSSLSTPSLQYLETDQ